ncbi:MAG TPA: type II toxin-antitoxin system prevent-host-death family antitoxin [Vicinamibacterales bacterium]|nr:type II toxin-antitoxin system prevent-host-death family antitoxin [Vicinamibacterales bacterium]
MDVNASQFKAKCLALIDLAHATGEVITITKRGRVVAQLIGAASTPAQPWRELRGSAAAWTGDPFAPVLSEDEVDALR